MQLESTMSDDPKKTGADRQLISVEQEYELSDWAASLGCTVEQLRAAVKADGHSEDDVRRYLAGHR